MLRRADEPDDATVQDLVDAFGLALEGLRAAVLRLGDVVTVAGLTFARAVAIWRAGLDEVRREEDRLAG